MTTTHHFDLVVLGDDLAGLIVAALVSARGQRVCVLTGAPADAAVTTGGRTMEFDPRPFTVAGSPFVRAVFEELGQWLQIRREVAALPGCTGGCPRGSSAFAGAGPIITRRDLGFRPSSARAQRPRPPTRTCWRSCRRGRHAAILARSVLDDAPSDSTGARAAVPPDSAEQEHERILKPRRSPPSSPMRPRPVRPPLTHTA